MFSQSPDSSVWFGIRLLNPESSTLLIQEETLYFRIKYAFDFRPDTVQVVKENLITGLAKGFLSEALNFTSIVGAILQTMAPTILNSCSLRV